MESARFFGSNPTSTDMINMFQDIERFGKDVIVVGDGASYNKSHVTTNGAIKLTGKPLAIVPPYSPFLSCPE